MSSTQDFATTLPDRTIIAITGEDARSFLQRVITRGPQGLTPDTAQFSALLTPQGKVLADFILFDDGKDGLLIDVPASEADGLIKRFTLYRLRARAEITLRDDLAVAAARGEGEEDLRMVATALATDPRSDALGVRAAVPAGGPTSDLPDYHAARIGAGIPEFGHDYGSSEVFSTDVNHDLIGGVDYKKGCFVGQEVASRMHRKGGVRKRTLTLAFEGEAPIARSAILAGEVEVGSLTSSQGNLALGLVRVDRLLKVLDGGAMITVSDQPAKILTDMSSL
jgi:folate-binding protein YgfZ